MRRILDVVVDVLTLLALVVAGVGHMLPWFREPFTRAGGEESRVLAVDLMRYQAFHAIPSGIALLVLAGLVALSLLIAWGPMLRRLLVLLMFACTIASIFFITLSLTHYPVTEWHERFAGNLRIDHFPLALAPVCFAAALCLIRMIWTMPAARPKQVETFEVPEAVPAKKPVHRSDDAAERAGLLADRQ